MGLLIMLGALTPRPRRMTARPNLQTAVSQGRPPSPEARLPLYQDLAIG